MLMFRYIDCVELIWMRSFYAPYFTELLRNAEIYSPSPIYTYSTAANVRNRKISILIWFYAMSPSSLSK